jgi:hypothetical protein
MKTLMFAIALLVSSAASAQSTKAAHILTKGMYNGRFWLLLSSTEKDIFLCGFLDGLSATISSKEDANKITKLYGSSKGTVADQEKGLDQFYADPANLSIPMAWALNVFAEKVLGETAASVTEHTEMLRKIVAEDPAP